MTHLVLVSISLNILFGLMAVLFGRLARVSTLVGVAGVVLSSLVGLYSAVEVLLSGSTETIHFAWNIPYGAFEVGLDPLSAFFLIPIFFLSALAAIYGGSYLWPYRTHKSLGPPWFHFNALMASMVMVIISRNAVLFLMAWELMSLSSFLLVVFEHEKKGVQQAGWMYLVATHLGTIFLIVLFIILSQGSATMGFEHFSKLIERVPGLASLIFILAVVGFGTKAGFLPFHIWLPEAHPAAPSHVSSVMSGVMIKTGIYGLLRILTFLGPPPAWWGGCLIGIGLSSGVLGVLFALAQHDLKRLLAYHSVENIGIIALGLGVGMLGLSSGSVVVAVLGFGGGLLHVLNHALFKGLLFLGAGSVLHTTGVLEIDRLGGLLKKMPWTAVTFLVGALAISGLPPFNGFVSEFLIYLAAFKGSHSLDMGLTVSGIAVIAGLALIGGLALACFTKAFGIVFLGEKRQVDVNYGPEAGGAMRFPMGVLALGCIGIGLFSPWMIRLLLHVLSGVTGLESQVVQGVLGNSMEFLGNVVMVSGVFLAFVVILVILRYFLVSSKKIEQSVTWGCGYTQPSPRMQYTASSFAQPLTSLFNLFLRAKHHGMRPQGLFPKEVSLHVETPDIFRARIFAPVFSGIEKALSKLRWLQHGNVQLYILYVVLTLLALLVWKLGVG